MIKTNQTIKQILDFNKTAMDNIFTAFSNIGDQREEIFRSYVDRALLPDSSKKMMLKYVEMYRKGWSDIKKVTDETYKTFTSNLEGDK